MCILLYVKLIWCSGFPEIYAWIGGYICLQYMCILLYVKLILCSGFPEIYAQLGGQGMSAFGICAFCYMWNLFGVVVLHRSMVDCRRWWWGYICHQYMCILLYVKLIWVVVFQRSMLNWRSGGWGQSAMGICAFCYMWNLFGVVVLHRSYGQIRGGQ